MASTIVGIVIVVGVCIALWWHSGVRDQLLQRTENERERRFIKDQYRRRSFTTTLIGLLGLSIMATELSQSVLLDAVLLGSMLILVLWILWRAFADILATRNHFQQADQGVRAAKRAMIDELREIEKRREEKKNSDSPQ